jgi:hypothetical protein
MAHMTLPAAHSEADYLLAERIGRTLGLREVHVFWTLAPGEPRREPAPETTKRTDPPGGLIGALVAIGDLFERLGARLVARD